MGCDAADVAVAIEELRLSMRSVRDESELLKRIEDGVSDLRSRYRRDPAAFGSDDVQFLRGLEPVTRALRAFLDEKRQREMEARIRELEQTPRRCRRGHRMTLRDGPRGHFWGCGAYPFCHHVKLLTREEREYLHGAGGPPPAGLANATQMSLV